MNLIKLPSSLGLLVIKILNQHNIEPRKTENGSFAGMLSFEFSQEELDLVKELNVINPSPGCLDGIENLRCLEVLNISTIGSTAYQKSPCSINDKDISKIGKINSLKSLKINNQSKITWVYLDHLKNLEHLEITRNTSLTEIFGLNKLSKVKDFIEFGNKELFVLEGINELIDNNNLEFLQTDLLHFNEIFNSLDKLSSCNCWFSETLRSKNTTIDYRPLKMLCFHKKCFEIAREALNSSFDRREQIIFVENYLAKNIKYDYEALKFKKRAHIHDGVLKGKENGINSAFNGVMYGFAVCEGYTRSMQYILKLMDIHSKNVYCIGGANKISINESYHDKVSLPNDGYHSIIRIDSLDSIYYCDPCWDSCHFHEGDNSLPYCLLTKNEILKSHSLSFEEDNVAYDIPYPRSYISSVIQSLNNKENNKIK